MWKVDTHCDVLWKMWRDSNLSFYETPSTLQVHMNHIRKSQVKLQTFAVFVPPSVPVAERFYTAIKMIDIFFEKIVKQSREISLVFHAGDLPDDGWSDKQWGAILSLEGADALQGELHHLRILYRLGVRSMGLTWNWRNEAADGVLEPSPGGLSQFGRELVREAEDLGILLDISHLAEKPFWEVMEQNRDRPIIASHSNCKSVHNHPRNLTDEQIKAIMQTGGVIGLTFVPPFLSGKNRTDISDLLFHIEHVLSLGGENHLGFGSDFDGIDETMMDLTDAGEYNRLEEELLKRYPEKIVKKIFFDNWIRVYREVL